MAGIDIDTREVNPNAIPAEYTLDYHFIIVKDNILLQLVIVHLVFDLISFCFHIFDVFMLQSGNPVYIPLVQH